MPRRTRLVDSAHTVALFMAHVPIEAAVCDARLVCKAWLAAVRHCTRLHFASASARHTAQRRAYSASGEMLRAEARAAFFLHHRPGCARATALCRGSAARNSAAAAAAAVALVTVSNTPIAARSDAAIATHPVWRVAFSAPIALARDAHGDSGGRRGGACCCRERCARRASERPPVRAFCAPTHVPAGTLSMFYDAHCIGKIRSFGTADMRLYCTWHIARHPRTGELRRVLRPHFYRTVPQLASRAGAAALTSHLGPYHTDFHYYYRCDWQHGARRASVRTYGTPAAAATACCAPPLVEQASWLDDAYQHCATDASPSHERSPPTPMRSVCDGADLLRANSATVFEMRYTWPFVTGCASRADGSATGRVDTPPSRISSVCTLYVYTCRLDIVRQMCARSPRRRSPSDANTATACRGTKRGARDTGRASVKRVRRN